MKAPDDARAEQSREWTRAFAERVKHARGQSKLTQDELSNLVGFTRAWLDKVERAALRPHADDVVRLGAALDCDMVWLLTGEGDFRPPAPSIVAMREMQARLVRNARGLTAMATELGEHADRMGALLTADATAVDDTPETEKGAPRADPAVSQDRNEGRGW